jgi:hypothetical protein
MGGGGIMGELSKHFLSNLTKKNVYPLSFTHPDYATGF